VKRTLARVKEGIRLTTRVGLSHDEMEFLSGHNAQWEQQIAGLASVRMALPVIPREDLAAILAEIQGCHRDLVLRFMEVMFEVVSCQERILDPGQAMDILESIGDSFLGRGDWEALNRYWQHLVELAAEQGGKSQRAAFVSQLVHRLASQARIDSVVAELEKADVKTTPHIHRFLSLLPADTLPIQVQAFMHLPEGKPKTDLMTLLIGRGADLTDYLIERLKSGGSAAALVAVRQLRQLGTPRAVTAIVGSLSHPSLTLRREALGALKGLHSEEVRQAVLKLLSGPDAKEMGVSAIDFLLASNSPQDVAAVISFCMGDGFEALEVEEQRQIVRILASSGRDEVWKVFSDLLGRHSLIPRKKLVDLQLTLVTALGRKPDPRAASLIRSRLDLKVWRDPLREACEDALRRLSAPAPAGPEPAR
jgi:hypothetical protein